MSERQTWGGDIYALEDFAVAEDCGQIVVQVNESGAWAETYLPRAAVIALRDKLTDWIGDGTTPQEVEEACMLLNEAQSGDWTPHYAASPKANLEAVALTVLRRVARENPEVIEYLPHDPAGPARPSLGFGPSDDQRSYQRIIRMGERPLVTCKPCDGGDHSNHENDGRVRSCRFALCMCSESTAALAAPAPPSHDPA